MPAEPMTREEYHEAVATCPQFGAHGSPFRYCGMCPWTEEGPLGGFVDPSLDDAEAALARAKDAEGRAYDAWRDAVEAARTAAEKVNALRAATDG